jgi:hypothetical protein
MISTRIAPTLARPLALWAERARLALLSRLKSFERAYMPFAAFEDCNVGNVQRRQEAFCKNKENRDLILPFIAAWALRGLAMGAAMSTAEKIQSLGVDTALLQAAFGLAFTLCVVFCVVMWVGWLGLAFFKE